MHGDGVARDHPVPGVVRPLAGEEGDAAPGSEPEQCPLAEQVVVRPQGQRDHAGPVDLPGHVPAQHEHRGATGDEQLEALAQRRGQVTGSWEDEPSEDETDKTVWETDGAWSGDAEFPLFSPPAAWDAETRGEQRLLPGHTYAFAFYGHTDDQVNGAVTFTGSDLAKLKPGRVWADDRVMSAKEFEERTERAC